MDIKIVDRGGIQLNQVERFRYLGVTLGESGGSEEAVRTTIWTPRKDGWKKVIKRKTVSKMDG